jgi:hypothetical protein
MGKIITPEYLAELGDKVRRECYRRNQVYSIGPLNTQNEWTETYYDFK